MQLHAHLLHQVRLRRRFAVPFVSLLVLAHGVFILAGSLLDQLGVRHGSHINSITIDVPLLIGVSLIYLSSLLRKRKYNAWIVTLAAYTFYLGVNVTNVLNMLDMRHLHFVLLARILLLPLAILITLFIF